MSGIAGIINFDGKPVEPGLIEKMTASMVHRGSDGITHWVQGPIALGQCMMRTTPESFEEHLPLFNEDRSLVLVMDGRMDNWEALRRELLAHGAVLRSRADAELVLRAYEFWGTECPQHLEGDFSFAIVDTRSRKVFCARDCMGNKPFHYHWNGSTLVFASEVQAILGMPWVEQTFNEGMLAEFLVMQWSSRDETFWEGVLRLTPAHRMTIDRSGPKLQRYWEPDVWRELPFTRDEEYVEAYRELFFDVVRRTSRSHQEVAFEVSGGLDSSSVFCVAETLRKSGRLPAPAIAGYTQAFEDDTAAGEVKFARAVASHLGVNILEVHPLGKPLPWYQSWTKKTREFPGYPNGWININLWELALSKGDRTILTGIGGDEWTLGNRSYYHEELTAGRWKNLITSLAADIEDYGATASLKLLIRHGCLPMLPQFIKRLAHRFALANRCTSDDRTSASVHPWLIELATTRAKIHAQRKDLKVKARGQWAVLQSFTDPFATFVFAHLELSAAIHGLDLRHPFHNKEIIQFSVATPSRLKLRGRINRFLQRRALADILPVEVATRHDKADFLIVFRQHLDQMHETFLSAIPGRHPDWVKKEQIINLFTARNDEQRAHAAAWFLWSLFGCDVLSTSLLNDNIG